ncbi:MAG: ATP-binding protein [Bacteroidota bacterium]
MKLIDRFLEQRITKLLAHFPVVGILGSRQVGKTTLAQEIIRKNEKAFLYLDLERPNDLAKLSNAEFYLNSHQDKCIVLDEIQRKPELFALLRSLVDQKRIAGRFLILGSASPTIIKGASESLAGRIAYKELHGFNLLEITTKKDANTMIKHWVRGGYPNAYLQDDLEIRDLWHQNFIRTYTERDLPALGLRADAITMRNFLLMLANIHANLCQYETLSKSLSLTKPTIQKYINFFSESFIIRILPPYFMNIKKRLVKSPKIYFRDSGLLHSILGIQDFDELQGNPKLGASWEGYIIEQICQKLESKYECYFYRTHQGAEVDLVLTKGGKPKIAIELKYNDTPSVSRGFYNSIKDLQTDQNFVITPNSDDYHIAENIILTDLHTFLSKYVPQL